MNNTDICSDGFPFGKTDDEWSAKGNACDNCGKVFDPEDDETFLAKATGDNGELHRYAFCCYECACEFREKHGLVMNRLNECCFDLSFEHDPTVKRPDPVADAVKSIDIDSDSAAEPDAAAEPTEQPALVDDVHERKAAECLKEVVKQAMEINDLASKISSEKEYLKGLQKEYETLVKRQNDYILANANGIQLTFSDCDEQQQQKDDKAGADPPAGQPDDADPNAVAVDTMGWRMTPSSQLPIKLTEKQWAAVDAAFPTLGDLQDWLCQDRREKVPGVSQTVYDKLVDALNDYVTEYTARALNHENTDEEPADESNDD